jgi:hypothetical protein
VHVHKYVTQHRPYGSQHSTDTPRLQQKERRQPSRGGTLDYTGIHSYAVTMVQVTAGRQQRGHPSDVMLSQLVIDACICVTVAVTMPGMGHIPTHVV